MVAVKPKTFGRGGVHPPESKITAQIPIENAPVPKMVFLPVSQHIGAPAKPVVKVGDSVEEGQIVAEAVGNVSANIHSPIPGKVVDLKQLKKAPVSPSQVIVIEMSGSFRQWGEVRKDWEKMSREEILDAIKKAGIVGLGGAGFPTHVKLSPPPDKPIDTFIVNGAECEPYLTSDHRLMLEKADEIVEGIKIVMKVLGVDNAFIGIETNKPDAIGVMTQKTAGVSGVEVIPLKTRYPQGGEKQLIKAITGREVPSGGLPSDVGVVVHNVATVFAIYEAVVYEKPLIEKIVTVTGRVGKPGNYKIRVGTPIKDIIEEFEAGEYEKVIYGGPMMGIEVPDVNELGILKTTNGITFLGRKDIYDVMHYPCVNCGRCVMACPMGLVPAEIVKYVDALKVEDAVKIGLLDCIECGSCAYVCPSTIPLVSLIRYGKQFWKRTQARRK